MEQMTTGQPRTADPADVPAEEESLHHLEADFEEDRSWHKFTNQVADTGFTTILFRLPALMRMAFGMCWQASRADTLLTVLLQIGSGLLTALGLLATRGVLEQLFATGPTPAKVMAALPALAGVMVATAGKAILSTAAGWAQSRLAPRVKVEVELGLTEVTSRVELAAFDDDAYADDVERARQRGVFSTMALVNHAIDLLTSFTRFAAVAFTLLIIHPLLLPVLIVATIPKAWGAVRAARASYIGLIQWLARARRTWTYGYLLSDRRHAPEVRAFNLRAFLLERYGRLLRAILVTDLQVARQQTVARAIGGALSGIGNAGVYVLLGVLLIKGNLPLAAAGAAVFALQTGSAALSQLIFNINGCYEDGLYVTDLAEVRESTAARGERTSALIVGRPTEILVEDVSLTYPDADKPALSGASLYLRMGETIALVGENGSGKSTLSKLLGCTYPPTGGRIVWDGADIGDYGPEDLRRHISVVSQDFAHWPFTARDDIRIGDYHRPTTQLDIEDAARAAEAHDMITALRDGYDTLLDTNFRGGVDPSKGQWQRLAGARGFYKQARLLICDEPSAALDPRAEHALFQQLRRTASDRMTVLITHRLANIRHADRIYVLHDGQIIESGSHEDLMAADGTYAGLFSMQRAGYLEADQ